MQKLPAELISRIFVECWPAGQFVRPENCSVPLQPMGVCRQWRQIALCTPLLWSSLDTTSKRRSEFYPPPQARWKDWLSKSGNCPISLKLAFEKNQNEYWMEEWMRFVSSYGSRFARLQVVDERGMDLGTLLDCSSGTLEYFSLQNWSKTPAKLAMNCRLPSLKTLLLDLVVVDHSTLRHYSHSLTRLAFRLPDEHICTVEEIFSSISYCSSLQVLVCGRVTHGITEEMGVLGLPRLRSLTLVADESLEQDQPIFIPGPSLREQQPVVFPALNCLQVQSDFPPDLDDVLCEKAPDGTAGAERQCKVVMSSHLAFRVFDAGWTRLTRLEVNFEGRIYVLNTALLLCQNLHTLALTGHHCDGRSTSLLTELKHSQLAELFISVDSEVGDLFRMATFPRLRVLCIATLHCGGREDILKMLGRSIGLLNWVQLKESHKSAGWTKRTRNQLTKLLGPSTTIDVDLVHGDEEQEQEQEQEQEEQEQEEQEKWEGEEWSGKEEGDGAVRHELQ
ncbi:hypothetical protein EV363DRAFT_1454494 [Boletus edulis]|nr:hypothetical protein EV363DRAFT_1454494 [Boletus edulis]